MRILQAILLLYLALESSMDLKQREISVLHWIAALILITLTAVLISDIRLQIPGILPGCVLLLLSVVTNKAVGTGDGMALLLCGIVLGMEKAFLLFLMALMLMMPVAMWKIAVKKANRKEEMAFLPYLLCSYLVLLWI